MEGGDAARLHLLWIDALRVDIRAQPIVVRPKVRRVSVLLGVLKVLA